MDDSPKSQLTFRQAMSGQWQIPLAIVSLVAFVGLIWQLRPGDDAPTFDELIEGVQAFADQERYPEFYAAAEELRRQAQSEEQLARVHFMVAQVRVQELRSLSQWGMDAYRLSAPANYERIIYDYSIALQRNMPDPNTAASVPIFRDLALACWNLNQPEKAVTSLKKAIARTENFDAGLNRLLVQMLLASRPENYLENSMSVVEKLLGQPDVSDEDRSWAFVRKVDLLIEMGHEQQALDLLASADEKIRLSRLGDELEFLRGRALRRVGSADEADQVLRNLMDHLKDRGDVYAQAALELGRINYEQFRDHDARYYYQLVIDTQMGKEWYAAAALGMAECLTLQQRYGEAVIFYQDAVDQVKKTSGNRAVSRDELQQSLAQQAYRLGMLKRYDAALSFLEIEQQVASENDVDAADRFARMHEFMAEQLQEDLVESKRLTADREPTETEKQWIVQQNELITSHYEQAGAQFERVSRLVVGDDNLYADSLWRSASNYDKAGNAEKSIEAWKRFVEERQGQSRWPRAIFYLAQAYQAVGRYPEAIEQYWNLRQSNPRSQAALDSAVPLSRCYLALDPPEIEEAELLLISMLEDRTLTPASGYFRQSMFELGELYYNKQDYEKAMGILTEAIDRYADDPRLAKYIFLAADSHRQSGLALDEVLAQLESDPTALLTQEKNRELRRRYLNLARNYFSQSIDHYEKIPEGRRTVLDDLYLCHSWMYKADCLFDLDRYEEAVMAYEEVALRYQLTPTALNSFVQIVNCHIKLGNLGEARSANQRALWQLRKIPDEQLVAGPTSMSRAQWQSWFEWMAKSGLW